MTQKRVAEQLHHAAKDAHRVADERGFDQGKCVIADVAVDDLFTYTLVLKPVVKAIKEARDLVGLAFRRWGLDDYLARLVTSELVTNAQRVSTHEQHIVVRTYISESRVPTVEVWDECEQLPVVKVASPTDIGGRGMFVIDRLVVRWGTRPLEGGKVVWAELPRDEELG